MCRRDRLGCEGVPYVEACKFRNSLDEQRDAKAVFFAYAAMPERAKGPLSVRSRYITEDVPQGLGPVSYTHLDVYKRQPKP